MGETIQPKTPEPSVPAAESRADSVADASRARVENAVGILRIEKENVAAACAWAVQGHTFDAPVPPCVTINGIDFVLHYSPAGVALGEDDPGYVTLQHFQVFRSANPLGDLAAVGQTVPFGTLEEFHDGIAAAYETTKRLTTVFKDVPPVVNDFTRMPQPFVQVSMTRGRKEYVIVPQAKVMVCQEEGRTRIDAKSLEKAVWATLEKMGIR